MLELQSNRTLTNGFACGGDTYNTAYGIRDHSTEDPDVLFLTALGIDAHSKKMLKRWQEQGLSTQQVHFNKTKLPGLYLISTDALGERSFSYWRSDSAAKHFFHSKDFVTHLNELKELDCLYFSGITLAIMSETNREHLFKFSREQSSKGCSVAFDSNYRDSLWDSTNDAAHWIERAWEVADIALPTLEDETKIFGAQTLEEIKSRLINSGVSIGAIKLGSEGCHVFSEQSGNFIPAVTQSKVVDTTGAGDAFNGAFLATYIQSKNEKHAAEKAVAYAGRCVTHYGAIP
jgi:2-dehydro-3-deoxygluconokinase